MQVPYGTSPTRFVTEDARSQRIRKQRSQNPNSAPSFRFMHRIIPELAEHASAGRLRVMADAPASVFSVQDLPNVSIDQSGNVQPLSSADPRKKRKRPKR